MAQSVISLGLNVFRSYFIKKECLSGEEELGCRESDEETESLVRVVDVHRMKIRTSGDKTILSRCHTFPGTTVCIDVNLPR